MTALAALIAALGLIALALIPSKRQVAWWATVVNLGFLALISAYVFGADTYTNDGRSRWATREASDHILYIATVAGATIVSALFVLMATRGSRGWTLRSSLLLSGACELGLTSLIMVAFGAN